MQVIISLKTPSHHPTDAIDTVNQGVFEQLPQIQFIECKNWLEKIQKLRKLKPDYALGIGQIWEWPLLFFLPKKTKYIIAWHTLLKKTKAWPIRRKLFQKASLVIAVSDCAGKTVSQLFPDKRIISILNGVDLEFFNPNKADRDRLQMQYDLSATKPIVLFVGAQFKRKRPDLFLEIAKKIPNANFVLVGRKVDIDHIAKAGHPKNVTWIPSATREEIARLMASSEIFLFPSVNEPCAAVIPEALASGLPLILSKSCGNAELIQDGRQGYLVPIDEEEAHTCIEKVQTLLNNPKKRDELSQNARQYAEKNYDWKKVAQKYLEALN